MAGLIPDKSILKRTLSGLFQDNTYSSNGTVFVSDPLGPVSQLATKPINVPVSDATAGTNVPETPIGALNTALNCTAKVVSVTVTPTTAVAANGTNFETFNVYKRAAALPGTPVLIATLSTATTPLVAFQATALTLQAVAALNCLPGDVFTVSAAKSGTGAATGTALVTVQAEEY